MIGVIVLVTVVTVPQKRIPHIIIHALVSLSASLLLLLLLLKITVTTVIKGGKSYCWKKLSR